MSNIITLTITCPICGFDHSVDVEEAQLLAYRNGALIQNAFPTLSADDREIIKTGICPHCWNSIFSVEDFEDEVDEFESQGEDEEEPEFDEDYMRDYCDYRYMELNYDPYAGCEIFECDECY